MSPPKKVSSQTDASTVTSKGKKIAIRGTNPVDLHPLNPKMILEQVREEHLCTMTTPERTTNKHEFRLPAKGQLLQMLARLQKLLDV